MEDRGKVSGDNLKVSSRQRVSGVMSKFAIKGLVVPLIF